MKSSLLLTPLVTLLLTASLLADTIVLRDGKELTGVVVEKESYREVSYKKGRVNQTVPGIEVRSISYGRTSPEFQAGVAALDNGENLSAAANFLAAAEDEGLPDHVRATAYVETADALLASENYVDAVTYFDALLSKYKETRHLARAMSGRGKALFYMRKFDEAKKAFDLLKTEAGAKNLGERWGLEGEFFSLWANENSTGKDVIEDYRALRSKAAPIDNGLANRCALNMGRAYRRKARSSNDIKDVERAEKLFEEIIDKRLDCEADVVAGAYNGRADCAFDRALGLMKDGRNTDDALAYFRQARLDYLRVYVSYKGVTKEQPDALYGAGQSFLNIASLDSSESDAELNGRVMLKRLKDGYPLSEKAKQLP